jgi:serine/threonine-protein kinase
LIGEICDGKYRILRLLGEGGMGSVYEARQLESGQLVALKCIHRDLLVRGKNSVSRFQREAKALGALDADHIVRVLDSGVDPVTRAPYLVMELLDGEDLQSLLSRIAKLEPDTALRIAAQICLGLQKAHEARVMHRDIKPANIFLARGGGGEIVIKILDFGIAKIKPEASQSGPTTGLTRTGGLLGSPLYMSPEQARGLSTIDYTTDLWSLGMVLYRLLSGGLPHGHIDGFGDMIMAICSQIPRPIQATAPWVRPEVAAIVHGALQLEVDDRFPTATAMLDALLALLPDGCSLHEDLLRPVSAATCAVIAPKLPEVVQPVKNRSDPPARARWTALLTVGLLVAAGVVAVRFARAPAASPSGLAASTAPVPAPLVPAPLPALQRAKLVVLPADVAVEIDGKAAPVEGGTVEIEGALGSRHRVQLRKGKQERTDEVIMTDTGMSPDKLELETAKARPAAHGVKAQGASPATPQPIAPKPPAPGDSLIPDTFK